jgi:hypothetical protein
VVRGRVVSLMGETKEMGVKCCAGDIGACGVVVARVVVLLLVVPCGVACGGVTSGNVACGNAGGTLVLLRM